MAESRTAKSLKMRRCHFLLCSIYDTWLLVKKGFFDYLGSEVVGLETTAGNLLGF